MSAAAVAYQPVERGWGGGEPAPSPVPAFPLFTQANPLGIQFRIPFTATWSDEETPTEPTHPERQAFEIENAPEWTKETGVVREAGDARVLYPAGEPFGDDHPFRYDRNRRGDSYGGSDFSDRGQQRGFVAQHATGEQRGFEDPANEHEDVANDYLEGEDEDDNEEEEEDFSNERDDGGSDIFSAFGGGNAGDSLQDDPDFKERQALFEQATEDGGRFGGMGDFISKNDGPDFLSRSMQDNQFQDDQDYFSSEPETPVAPPMPPKASVRVRMAQNPFKLYAGEGSAPKFNFDFVDLGDEQEEWGEQGGDVVAQEQQPRPQKQLKEKFMKDREQLEAELNARGDSLYRTAEERPEGAPPPGRRLMGQAELRAQMAMQRIAAAAMRATSLRSKRGKKGGKRRGGGMPVIFI